MTKSLTESSLKIREVIYVISAVSWCLFQYFSLVQKIDSIASNQVAYKQLTDYRVMQLEQITKNNAREAQSSLVPFQGILPKKTTIEDEK